MAQGRWYKVLEKYNKLPETTPTIRKGFFASEPKITKLPMIQDPPTAILDKVP
jgi:hypothetical protein